MLHNPLCLESCDPMHCKGGNKHQHVNGLSWIELVFGIQHHSGRRGGSLQQRKNNLASRAPRQYSVIPHAGPAANGDTEEGRIRGKFRGREAEKGTGQEYIYQFIYQ